MAWEVRKFYPREYEIGKQALRLIAKDLEVKLADDEAASVALHFVNAQRMRVSMKRPTDDSNCGWD